MPHERRRAGPRVDVILNATRSADVPGVVVEERDVVVRLEARVVLAVEGLLGILPDRQMLPAIPDNRVTAELPDDRAGRAPDAVDGVGAARRQEHVSGQRVL